MGKIAGLEREVEQLRGRNRELEVLLSIQKISVEGSRDTRPLSANDTSTSCARHTSSGNTEEILGIQAQHLLDIVGVMLVALNTQGEVAFINKKGCQILGYLQEEIIGKSWFEHFLPEREKERVYTEFQRLMAGEIKPIEYYENSVLTKGGEEGLFAWHNTILKDDEGSIIGTFSSGEDITKRKQAEEALSKSRDELRNLTVHLEQVREEERTRIARDIHDELGQNLTALRMALGELETKKATDGPDVNEGWKAWARQLDQCVDDMYTICSELRPSLLDDFSINAALEQMVAEFETRTGIKCELHLDPTDLILGRNISTGLFRICKEALSNVIRHAGATTLELSLMCQANKAVLTVKDNGRGIEPEQVSNSKSIGLIGSRERAHAVGGEFKIEAPPDGGTKVSVIIPLETDEMYHEEKNTCS